MGGRLDNLAENVLVTRLLAIRDELRALKGRQRSSGLSGMVTYFTESNDPWDDTDTITGASGQLVELEVTYTGDGSQSYPMVTPYLDLFVNGTDEANRVPLDGTAYNDGSGNTAALRKMLLVDAAHLDDELVTKWFVEVLVNGTVTYYAKAYAAGTSRGTLTVVRTA